MPQHIGVVILGDHSLARAGIGSLLLNVSGVHVVGETRDRQEAVNMIAAAKREGTVLINIVIPQSSNVESIHQIRKKFPQTPIIVIALHVNEEFAWQALRAGVAGYLQNEAGLSELEQAIRAVSSGQIYLGPAISKQVVGRYVLQQSQDLLFEKVTPRQQEILKMIVEGLSTREIAKRLDISVRTVETHRFHLMERLGIRNVAGLVRFAMQTGLIKPKE